MLWFKNDTNKNPISSDEYGDCLKRFVKLNSELELLKAHFEAQKLQVDNLRGQFSRKLRGLKEEETKEEIKTETINNNEFIAFG